MKSTLLAGFEESKRILSWKCVKSLHVYAYASYSHYCLIKRRKETGNEKSEIALYVGTESNWIRENQIKKKSRILKPDYILLVVQRKCPYVYWLQEVYW